MSDKTFDFLDPVDQAIRRGVPGPGPGRTGVLLTIEYIGGFELFNTRAHHNYETFSDGYRVSDGTTTVEAEDLDDAIARYLACSGPSA